MNLLRIRLVMRALHAAGAHLLLSLCVPHCVLQISNKLVVLSRQQQQHQQQYQQLVLLPRLCLQQLPALLLAPQHSSTDTASADAWQPNSRHQRAVN